MRDEVERSGRRVEAGTYVFLATVFATCFCFGLGGLVPTVLAGAFIGAGIANQFWLQAERRRLERLRRLELPERTEV